MSLYCLPGWFRSLWAMLFLVACLIGYLLTGAPQAPPSQVVLIFVGYDSDGNPIDVHLDEPRAEVTPQWTGEGAQLTRPQGTHLSLSVHPRDPHYGFETSFEAQWMSKADYLSWLETRVAGEFAPEVWPKVLNHLLHQASDVKYEYPLVFPARASQRREAKLESEG